VRITSAARAASLVVLVSVLAGCISLNPSPQPSSSGTLPSTSQSAAGTPSGTPSATPPSSPPAVPADFPLAVVTGITNLKSTIGLDEVASLASRGRLVMPCGVVIKQPEVSTGAACRPANRIGRDLQKHQQQVALLPAGLVVPATKVLSIAGDGPFGLFGPDLFGDSKSRALDYPLRGSPAADGSAQLDPAWFAYDAAKVWTMTDIGSLCSSPLVADQAVVNGLGWGWVFNGGTAKYTAPAPVDPSDQPPYYTVPSAATGNDGATPSVLKRSDLAIADHECPIVPDAGWRQQTGSALVFTVPEAVVVQWKRKLGLDAVYLAANHMSDAGVSGIESTIRLLDKHHLPHTGLGMNLRQAIQPAFVDVAGLKVAIVAWNDVYGVARADSVTPGVPWITQENVNRAVRLARDGGADLVICSPQWWGGAEYHDDLWPLQRQQLGWFDKAGCDHVIGAGTHVAGPMLVRNGPKGPNVVLACPGNYMFGQRWWQEVDEGVILDLSFSGTRLVNVRLRPYVMYLHARPSLLDPQGDGRYVLQRIFKYSEFDPAS
jgi:hypothetical protein